MISVTYKQLRHINTNATLVQKLIHTPMPTKLAYNMQKLLDKLSEAGQLVAKEYTSFYNECKQTFAAVDADGKPVSTEDGQAFKVAPEHEEAYKKAGEEFEARVIKIDRYPLAIHQLVEAETLQLSVSELTILEPLVVDVSGAPSDPRGSLRPEDPKGDGPSAA
jgi:hypothetical protein